MGLIIKSPPFFGGNVFVLQPDHLHSKTKDTGEVANKITSLKGLFQRMCLFFSESFNHLQFDDVSAPTIRVFFYHINHIPSLKRTCRT